jgi:hypothetical protein
MFSNVVREIDGGLFEDAIKELNDKKRLRLDTVRDAADLKQLKYGVSVTDACIDWPTTEKLLRETRQKLKDVLPKRVRGTAEIRKISG